MSNKAFCPNCEAILDEQDGFDPDGDRWTCASCGVNLFEPGAAEGVCFEGVFWVCDNCGASLSSQPGFSDIWDEWMCCECGYTNRIAESEILKDGEEWNQLAFDSGMRRDEFGWSWGGGEDEEDQLEEEAFSSWVLSSEDDLEPRVDSELSRVTRETREYAQALRELNDEFERQQWQAAQIRRREFVQGHRKGILIACGLILILIVCVYAYMDYQKLRVVGIGSSEVAGQSYEQVLDELQGAGFADVTCSELYDLGEGNLADDGSVSEVVIAGDSTFSSDSKYPYDAAITIRYHSVGLASPPYPSNEVTGRDYRETEQGFRDAGFFNVRTEARNDSLIGLFNKPDTVESVTIDGDPRYPDGQEFRVNSEVVVYYHAPAFGG